MKNSVCEAGRKARTFCTRQVATLCVALAVIVGGAVALAPVPAMATDIELPDLGTTTDMGGIALAFGSKIAADYQDIFLVLAAVAVVIMIGWFLFGGFKRVVH